MVDEEVISACSATISLTPSAVAGMDDAWVEAAIAREMQVSEVCLEYRRVMTSLQALGQAADVDEDEEEVHMACVCLKL